MPIGNLPTQSHPHGHAQPLTSPAGLSRDRDLSKTPREWPSPTMSRVFTSASTSISELVLPGGIQLRPMKASDVPAVQTLHSTLLPTTYPSVFFIQLLLQPRYLCLLATHGDIIVGFASATIAAAAPPRPGTGCSKESKEQHAQIMLLTLGVQPAYRRRGIGRALVHSVARALRTAQSVVGRSKVLIQAEVLPVNTVGKCFYSRLGMRGEAQGRMDMMAGLLYC